MTSWRWPSGLIHALKVVERGGRECTLHFAPSWVEVRQGSPDGRPAVQCRFALGTFHEYGVDSRDPAGIACEAQVGDLLAALRSAWGFLKSGGAREATEPQAFRMVLSKKGRTPILRVKVRRFVGEPDSVRMVHDVPVTLLAAGSLPAADLLAGGRGGGGRGGGVRLRVPAGALARLRDFTLSAREVSKELSVLAKRDARGRVLLALGAEADSVRVISRITLARPLPRDHGEEDDCGEDDDSGEEDGDVGQAEVSVKLMQLAHVLALQGVDGQAAVVRISETSLLLVFDLGSGVGGSHPAKLAYCVHAVDSGV